jgi:hypothetical protein
VVVGSLLVICLHRYWSIKHQLLNAEVETYAASSVKNNLATGKTATQSSTLKNFLASRAIDGNTNTFSHTNDGNAWLQIDLEDVYFINCVKILNRWCVNPKDSHRCLCRLSGVTLTLIDTSESVVATQSIGNTCGLQEVTVQFDDTCSTPTQVGHILCACVRKRNFYPTSFPQ